MMKNEPSCWLLAVLMRADPLEEDEFCACIIIKLKCRAFPKPLRVAGKLYALILFYCQVCGKAVYVRVCLVDVKFLITITGLYVGRIKQEMPVITPFHASIIPRSMYV